MTAGTVELVAIILGSAAIMVTALAMSTARGRRICTGVFAIMTAVWSLKALAFYLSGDPAWTAVLSVTAGLDLFIAVMGSVMAAIERLERLRRRRTRYYVCRE